MDKGWMTITGAIMLALSGGLGAIAQLPVMIDWKPYIECVALFLGSSSASMMGYGIRRKLPTGVPKAPGE